MPTTQFETVRKVLRHFSMTNKEARKQIEEIAEELYVSYDMNAGDMIKIINKAMYAANLENGNIKDD